MLTNSPSANLTSYRPFDRVRRSRARPRCSCRWTAARRSTRKQMYVRVARLTAQGHASSTRSSPRWRFLRRCRQAPAVTWNGMAAEIVQATRRQGTEYRFRAQRHLLAVYEQGVRSDGDTFVEGLPRSSLRDLKTSSLSCRLATSIMSGRIHAFSRAWCFSTSIRPRCRRIPRTAPRTAPLAPRLFFEDAALWDTALKLKRLIESGGTDNRLYLEALGVVLAHELVRLDAGARASSARAGRPCRLAAADRHGIYRGASRRADPARHSRAACAPQPVSTFAGRSSNPSACRRIAITTSAASSTPRCCWPSLRHR